MAREWDERHFELLQKLPEQEVRRLFDVLSEEDKRNLVEGFRRWKLDRPVDGSVPGPELPPPVKLPPSVKLDPQPFDAQQELRDFAKTVAKHPAITMTPEEELQRAAPDKEPMSFREGLSMYLMANPLTATAGAFLHPTVEKKVLDPIAKGFQKHIGRPAMENLLLQQWAMNNPPLPGETEEQWRARGLKAFAEGAREHGNEEAAHKMLTGMGAFFAGQSFSEDVLGPETVEKARSDMLSFELPIIGGEVYPGEMGAAIAGDPFTFTPAMSSKAIESASWAKRFPRLNMILSGAAGGVEGGALSGVISPDLTIGEGAVVGGLLGGSISVTGAAASKSAELGKAGFKAVARITRDGMAKLGDEINRLIDEVGRHPVMAEGIEGPMSRIADQPDHITAGRIEAEMPHPDANLAKQTQIGDPSFRPGMAFLLKKDGKFVLRLVQLSMSERPVTYAEAVISDDLTARTLGSILQENNIRFSVAEGHIHAVNSEMPPEWIRALIWGVGSRPNANVVLGGVEAVSPTAPTREIPVVQREASRSLLGPNENPTSLNTPKEMIPPPPPKDEKGNFIKVGPHKKTKEVPVAIRQADGSYKLESPAERKARWEKLGKKRGKREKKRRNKAARQQDTTPPPDPDQPPPDLEAEESVVVSTPDGVKVLPVDEPRPKLPTSPLEKGEAVQAMVSPDKPPVVGIITKAEDGKVTVLTTDGDLVTVPERMVARAEDLAVLKQAGEAARGRAPKQAAAGEAAPDELSANERKLLSGTLKLNAKTVARSLKISEDEATKLLAGLEAKGHLKATRDGSRYTRTKKGREAARSKKAAPKKPVSATEPKQKADATEPKPEQKSAPEPITDPTERYMIREFLTYTDVVTPRKLAGFMGVTPKRAVEIIAWLEHTGAIVRRGNHLVPNIVKEANPPAGVTTPAETAPVAAKTGPTQAKGEEVGSPPPAEPPSTPPQTLQELESAKPGSRVYVEPAAGTQTRQGVVVAVEGDKTTVQFADGSRKTYPSRMVHPTTPPGIARHEDLVGGVPVPMPPPPNLPPQAAKEVQEIAALVQQTVQDRKPGIFRKIAEAFLDSPLLAPEWARHLLMRAKAAQGLAHNRWEILRQARRNLPSKQLFDKAATDMSKVAEGNMSLSDFAQKHPEMGKRMIAFWKDLLDESQRLSREIEEMGGIAEGLSALRDEGLLEQYVANVYRAFYLGKGRWAEIIPSQDLMDGIAYLTKKADENKLGWNHTQIMQEVLEIINAADTMERFRKSPLSKPFAHLLARKEIPLPIQKLLGKETSGPLRVAISIANQRAIHAQLKVWDEIHKARITDELGREINPYWSPGPRHDLTVRVPDNKRFYGRAAGGYVSEELASIVNAVKPDIAVGLAAQRALGVVVKQNLLLFGGGIPWVNNVIRNMKGCILAGGILPWHMLRAGKDLFAAVSEIVNWHRKPADPNGHALIMEARTAGALPTGFGHMEAMSNKQKQLWKEIGLQLGTWKGKDFFGILEAFSNIYKKYSVVPEGLATVWDAIDQVFKLANYIALRRQFLAEAPKKGFTGQKALEYASRRAAYRIKQSFPDYENVAPIVEKIRNSPFGALAPFASGLFEDLRITALIAPRLVEESDLRWRLLGAGAFMTNVWLGGVLLRRMNGISDEEVEAARQRMTQREKIYRPGLVAAPFRDNGEVVFYDLGQPFPELQFLYGHPDDHVLRRIAANMLLTPVQGSATEDSVRSYMEELGMVRPIQHQSRRIEGNQGIMQLIDKMFQTGLLPKAPHAIYTELSRGGATDTPVNQGRGEQGPITTAGRIFGVNLRQAPQTMRPVTGEFAAEINDLQSQLRSVYSRKWSNDPQEDAAIKEKLKNEIIERIRHRASQIQEAGAAQRAAGQQQ